MRSGSGQPPLAHNFQHRVGFHNEPLGGGGGRGGGRPRGPQVVNTLTGGVFLFRKRHDCVNAGGPGKTVL